VITAAEIAHALKGKKSGAGWECHCPAHSDRNASFSVSEGEDGKTLVCCHAGCTQDAVIEVLQSRGLWHRDDESRPNGQYVNGNGKHDWFAIPVPPNVRLPDGGHWPDGAAFPDHELGSPSSVVWFHNEAGEVVVGECRFDITNADGKPDKEYRPLTYGRRNDGGRCEWRWKGTTRPYPLLDLPALTGDPTKPIIITEGARKAEIARELFPNFVATAPLFGAHSPKFSDWSPVLGRNVVIWPDNDMDGAKFAGDVTDLVLEAGAKAVSVVEIPASWPRKWDLRDPLPDGVTDDVLVEMLRAALPWVRTDAGASRRREVVDDQQGDAESKYAELAALPLDEYDHRRNAAAQQLGIRPSTLDELVKAKRKLISVGAAPQPGRQLKLRDPEPWPEPVNGPSLLDNAVSEVRRYVVLEECEVRTIALWIIASHAFRSFKVFPRLFISAADKSCGKTTSLEVIFHQVPRAMMVSNASAAALFRVIEQARPTLLLDEADSFVRNNEDLRGIIDAGHRFDGNVVRCVDTKDGFEPRLFSVWAAMVLAAIGHLPSTIEDRCVKIRLRRRLADETVETLRIGKTERLEMIAQQAARWTKDNAEGIAAADPMMPKEIINRQADNWHPLFAVADLIGPRWGEYARDAAIKISSTGETSMRELLLTDIKELFDIPLPGLSPAEQFSAGLPAVLFTKEILESLNNKDDRPWPEWGKERKPMTGPQLAKLLKPLRIPTGKAVRRGEEVAKGYRREDLADAFKRYARPSNVSL
jgi:hypothetical protein